ncbi:MAG TPA: type IV pilus modification protein PilV [Rhodanobacter sp.]
MTTPLGLTVPRSPAALAARRIGRLHTQSGVGLIEVLVAVLVLSIGFLGIAALQAMSLSTNNSAMARSMATIASYSIMDAMRADSVRAKAGNYNTTVTADACGTASAGSLPSAQLVQWCNQLGHGLGATANTTGGISCSGAGECTVTITFDDSRAGVGGSATQTVITKAIL